MTRNAGERRDYRRYTSSSRSIERKSKWLLWVLNAICFTIKIGLSLDWWRGEMSDNGKIEETSTFFWWKSWCQSERGRFAEINGKIRCWRNIVWPCQFSIWCAELGRIGILKYWLENCWILGLIISELVEFPGIQSVLARLLVLCLT